jgi:hypothetical protein
MSEILACKLMSEAHDDPQKYEGKKYKATADLCTRTAVNPDFMEVWVSGGILLVDDCKTAFISSHTIPSEVPQPVPFMEAVKTFSENKSQGKKCRLVCEYEGGVNVYGGTSFTTVPDNEPVTFAEIVYGTWRVEE